MRLIRNSLLYVPSRERDQVARDLKPIYTATDADAAQTALETFDEQWAARFQVITQAWLNAWEHVTPFLAFPDEVRRVIYTTDESVKGQSVGIGLFSGDGSVAGSARRAAGRLLRRRFGSRGSRQDDFGRARACPPRGVVCGRVSVGVTFRGGRGRPRSEAQVLGLMPAAQLAPQRAFEVASRWRRPRPAWSLRVPWLASRRRADGMRARLVQRARARTAGRL